MTKIKIDFNIGCRGKDCKEVHTFDHVPEEDFKCKCGYQLIKDGMIYPSGEKK
jgi:hypothetical protein